MIKKFVHYILPGIPGMMKSGSFRTSWSVLLSFTLIHFGEPVNIKDYIKFSTVPDVYLACYILKNKTTKTM